MTFGNSAKKTVSFQAVLLEKSLALSTLGASILVGALLSYSVLMQNAGVSASGLGILDDVVYATLVIVITGLSMIITGLTYRIRSHVSSQGESTITVISNALKDSTSCQISVIASMIYGLFFAVVSGTLVVRPGATFSQTYGVSVPSSVTVVCCGSLGQIPQLVVYATQQVAVLLVPLNLILLVFLSWLVGLNFAIVAYAYKGRPQSNSRWLTGLGAIVGLFTACPTCAGLFLMSSVGLSSTLVGTLALGSLQVAFVLISLPLLVATLLLSSRKVTESCMVPPRPKP